MRNRVFFSSFVLCILTSPAMAGNHTWDFSEVFSTSDGRVQFIEMFTPNDFEHKMIEAHMASAATGQLYFFAVNLPSFLTGNKWLLVATSAFAALEGAPLPDYIMPDGFFDPAGDTLTYKVFEDSWTFGPLPSNGTDSLHRGSGVGVNSPINFAGDTGSVAAVPLLPSSAAWGIVLLVCLLLLVASGLLRRPTYS